MNVEFRIFHLSKLLGSYIEDFRKKFLAITIIYEIWLDYENAMGKATLSEPLGIL